MKDKHLEWAVKVGLFTFQLSGKYIRLYSWVHDSKFPKEQKFEFTFLFN